MPLGARSEHILRPARVSTIALSGVITRMPLVCISIVASAFQ